MQDYGTRHTDLAVKRAEWRLSRVYHQAAKDIDEKLKAWQKGHEAREKRYRQQLADGKITQADFDAWMRGQVFHGEQWKARKEQIQQTLLQADRAAANIVNDGKLGVFATNANYIGYGLEHDANINTGFTLYDEQTVARLVKSDPKLLPPAKVKKDKAFSYYNKLINHSITLGIIEGEDIRQIAKRIAQKTGESSYKSAVRNARTAYTGAQNAGRIEGLHQAQSLGIKVQKQWMATLDSRTRDAHADLDGQIQEVDDPFESDLGDIMFPGDPTAEPGNVYNCRCTLVYVYPEYPSEMQRRTGDGEIVGDMTYREWEAIKQGEGEAPEPEEPKIRIPEFEPAKTRAEAEEYAGRFADSVSYNGLSVDNCNAINRQLNELTTRYPITKLDAIEQKRMSAVMSASAKRLNIDGKKLGSVLNTALDDFKKSQEYARQQIENIKARFAGKAKMPFSEQSTIDKLSEKLKFKRYGVHEIYEDHVMCTVAHEYGHILSDQYFGMINKDRGNPNYKTNWGLAGRARKWDEAFQQARKTGDIYGISEYANRNSHEFFAECFAAREMGEKLPDYVESLMKETLKDGIM